MKHNIFNIYNCCCLCLEEDKNNGGNLIWNDGMQLCKRCYDRYTENPNNEKVMLINAIKSYRRILDE